MKQNLIFLLYLKPTRKACSTRPPKSPKPSSESLKGPASQKYSPNPLPLALQYEALSPCLRLPVFTHSAKQDNTPMTQSLQPQQYTKQHNKQMRNQGPGHIVGI